MPQPYYNQPHHITNYNNSLSDTSQIYELNVPTITLLCTSRTENNGMRPMTVSSHLPTFVKTFERGSLDLVNHLLSTDSY